MATTLSQNALRWTLTPIILAAVVSRFFKPELLRPVAKR